MAEELINVAIPKSTHKRMAGISEDTGVRMKRLIVAYQRGWDMLTPEQQRMALFGDTLPGEDRRRKAAAPAA